MAIVKCDDIRFWDIEQVGTSLTAPSKANSAEHIRNIIDSSVHRDLDGLYIVGFPWKTDHTPLLSNCSVCEKRAQSLARKLARTPELLKTYGAIITKKLSLFIERVQESDIPQDCHFIPRHAVKKESEITPLRIVYDCSCHLSSCLNDCLVVGPPFLIDICTLLVRFRTHRFALTTDIEKAFLHIQLAKEYCRYTHFSGIGRGVSRGFRKPLKFLNTLLS